MAGNNAYSSGNGGTQKMSMARGWNTDKWVALIVLLALALLIAIRMGFRGVNVMGISAGVS